MVWAAVSVIFRLQHVFVAVERFFPVLTPPSDISLPVFIAKYSLLMVFCWPTFRLCSYLFQTCWRPDGTPAVGNAKGQSKRQSKKSVQRGLLFWAEAGLQRAVYRVVAAPEEACRLNRLTGQGALAEEGGWADDKQRKSCEGHRHGCNEVASWHRAWRAGPNEKALQWRAFVTAT